MSNFFKIRVSNSKTKFTTYTGEIIDGKFKIDIKTEAEVPTDKHTSGFEEHKVKCKAGQKHALVLASPIKNHVGKAIALEEKDFENSVFEQLSAVEEKPIVRKTRARKTKSKVTEGIEDKKE